MGSETRRVAVVQAASVAFDAARTLEKTADLAADSRKRGASLTLFPEAFVSGYPRGSSFGAVVGSRTPEGREQFRLYWASAIDIRQDYPWLLNSTYRPAPNSAGRVWRASASSTALIMPLSSGPKKAAATSTYSVTTTRAGTSGRLRSS